MSNTENKPFPKAGEAVQLEQFVSQCKYTGQLTLHSADLSANGYPCFGTTTVTFTMPSGDAIQAMVASLEKQIEKENADHHVMVSKLKGRIQELLAIGHDGGEA